MVGFDLETTTSHVQTYTLSPPFEPIRTDPTPIGNLAPGQMSVFFFLDQWLQSQRHPPLSCPSTKHSPVGRRFPPRLEGKVCSSDPLPPGPPRPVMARPHDDAGRALLPRGVRLPCAVVAATKPWAGHRNTGRWSIVVGGASRLFRVC
jgi:hypothetical protein